MKTHLLISKSYEFSSVLCFQSPMNFLLYYATSRVRITFEIWGARRESGRLFFLEPIQYIYWKTKVIIWPKHVLTDSEMLLSSMQRCLYWMCIQSLTQMFVQYPW